MIIYKAENLINGKVYIGKTGYKLSQRRWGHFNSAKKGGKSAFYSAIRKYGEEKFEFSVLEKCDEKDDMNEIEKLYIAHYNTMVPNGYNLTVGGDGQIRGWKNPSKSKWHHTEEARKVIKEKRALQVYTDETKKKMSNSQMGHPGWNKGLTKETNASVLFQSEKVTGNVPWNKGLKGFMKGRAIWNKGLTKEDHPAIKAQSGKMIGKTPWNAGLTKDTDPRVAQYAESLRNSEAPGVWKKGQVAWNKGISIPQTE